MGWGEFFSLASPMAWALAVVIFRRSGENMPAYELNFFKNAFSLLLMALTLLAVALVSGDAWPVFTSAQYAVMLASGILGMALADTLYFKTLQLVGAGRTGVIGSLLSPCVILVSAILLGERLSGWQWLGFALVMAGILVVTVKHYQTEVSAADLRRGLLLGVAAMAIMAVGVVMVKPILEQGPFLWVVAFRLAGGVLAMLALTSFQRRWAQVMAVYRRPQPWGKILFASFLGGFGGSVLWLAGYKLISASEASIYNEAQGGFMVLFAWLILGEAITVRKVLGVLLTVAGVLVMLLV